MIFELEKMCQQIDFDKNTAEKLLAQIDVNQEFVSARHSWLTTNLLECAIIYANYEMVKLLLEKGADPNMVYNNGTENVLWDLQYAEEDTKENEIRLNIVKLLLENGANPHIVVENEDLYHWATACWQDDMGTQAKYRSEFISLLEDYGA